MTDNPNAHKPCQVRDYLPMVIDSTYGNSPFYELVCKCGAIEVYDFDFGLTATTQRCYRCCGVAFGLRKRQDVTKASLKEINRVGEGKLEPIFINGKAHTGLRKLPLSKLEHLLQLAKVDVENYKVAIRNYPPDRMAKYGQPHLERLLANCDYISKFIKAKQQAGGST